MADIIPQFFLTQESLSGVDFRHSMNCVLCSGTYNETWLKDLEYYSELSGCEIGTSNGYTSGGIEVSGTSAYTSASGDITLYTCDDIVFSASSGDIGPVRYGVIKDNVNNIVVYVFDFSKDQTIINGSSLYIQTDNAGFMKKYQTA